MARVFLLVLLGLSLVNFRLFETAKDKQFIFKDYYITNYTFNYTDKDERPLKVVQFLLNRWDSVLVYHGSEVIASFHLKDGVISDSSLTEYDSGRMTSTYTFSKRRGWFDVRARRKTFYGRYAGVVSSEKVYWPNGKLKLERYIGESSADSMTRTWYSSGTIQLVETGASHGEYDGNGHLRKEILYDQRGGDSLVKEWYPGGVISRIWSGSREMKYYGNGILREVYAGNREAYYDSTGALIEEVNRDTVIEGRNLMYTKEYAKGILRYEKFFGGYEKDWPCYTWREYDERGKPLKTVKKAPLESMPVFVGTVEGSAPLELPEQIYVHVSQNPEFNGGTEALYSYLDNALNGLDKKTLKKFKGAYRLNIRIHYDGKVGFISMQGENSAHFTEAMAAIVENMTWRPARIDGRLIDSEVAIMFEAK